MLEKVREPVDAVITTAAGYPLDLTYYQAIKGVTAAQHIVRDGGTILLLAQCCRGDRGGGIHADVQYAWAIASSCGTSRAVAGGSGSVAIGKAGDGDASGWK